MLHAMPSSTYARDEDPDFHILCASLRIPASPTGIGIRTLTQNSLSNSATVGGILRIDNTLYGITVGHMFEESRIHGMTLEEELTFDLSELDIYEDNAPQFSAASQGLYYRDLHIEIPD